MKFNRQPMERLARVREALVAGGSCPSCSFFHAIAVIDGQAPKDRLPCATRDRCDARGRVTAKALKQLGAPGVPCSANGGEALPRANGRLGSATACATVNVGNDRLSFTGRQGATASPGSGRQTDTGIGTGRPPMG